MGEQDQGRSATPGATIGHISPAQRLRFSRWLPFIPLILALAAVGLHVQAREGTALVVVWWATLASILAFSFGPLRAATRSEPLDEREQLLLARARLAGANAALVLAAGGALVVWKGARFGIWKPTTDNDWWLVSCLLGIAYLCVASLYARWNTRPIEEEE